MIVSISIYTRGAGSRIIAYMQTAVGAKLHRCFPGPEYLLPLQEASRPHECDAPEFGGLDDFRGSGLHSYLHLLTIVSIIIYTRNARKKLRWCDHELFQGKGASRIPLGCRYRIGLKNSRKFTGAGKPPRAPWVALEGERRVGGLAKNPTGLPCAGAASEARQGGALLHAGPDAAGRWPQLRGDIPPPASGSSGAD